MTHHPSDDVHSLMEQNIPFNFVALNGLGIEANAPVIQNPFLAF